MVNPFIASQRTSKDLVEITPELATFLLEHYNPINCRPIDWAEARKRIARSITNGEWDEDSGARLIFERNTGFIIDGQTRLAAIADGKISVRCDVLFGVKRSVYSGYGGRTRSIGASIVAALDEGCDKAVAYSKMAGVARVWLRFENKWESMRFTRKEVMNFILGNRRAIETMLEKRTFKETRRAGVAAALAFYYTHYPSKAMKFFNAITGDPYKLKRFSPEAVLRDYLVNVNSTKQHPEKQLKNDFTATLAACAAHLQGAKMKMGIVHKPAWP